MRIGNLWINPYHIKTIEPSGPSTLVTMYDGQAHTVREGVSVIITQVEKELLFHVMNPQDSPPPKVPPTETERSASRTRKKKPKPKPAPKNVKVNEGTQKIEDA